MLENMIRFIATIVLPCLLLLLPLAAAESTTKDNTRWFKGNLNTNTYWSDGDQMPEIVIEWFKERGYHFIALSEHDRPPVGDFWKTIAGQDNPEDAWQTVDPDIFTHYRKKFGKDWVQTRNLDGQLQVRLKPIHQLQARYNEPQKFLVMPSQKLWTLVQVPDKNFTPENPGTAWINAANSYEVIHPAKAPTSLQAAQQTIDNMNHYAQTKNQPIAISLIHPNYLWSMRAEDIMHLRGFYFMDIYTALSFCNNQGDRHRASTERIWDIVLTKRLAELNLPPVYGIANDDCHTYVAKPGMRNWGRPGRGWIMVKSPQLTPESLFAAMQKGHFYASSGVTLKDIQSTDTHFSISINVEEGITYQTQFIATLQGYDPHGEPVLDPNNQPIFTTNKYSPDIGRILLETSDPNPAYNFKGNEIYVRAKVTSSRPHPDPSWPGQKQSAWTQPVIVPEKN